MSLTILLALLAAFSIALGGWFVFVEYPRSAIDATRNELFSIRYELFELARDGEIAFDHAAYTEARNTLNGMIRYAHDVSFLHLIFTFAFASPTLKAIRKVSSEMSKSRLASAPKRVRPKVEALLVRAGDAMAKLVVMRSAGFSGIVAAGILGYGVISGSRQLVGVLQHKLKAAPENEPQHSNADEVMEVLSHGPMTPFKPLIMEESRRRMWQPAEDCWPQAA